MKCSRMVQKSFFGIDVKIEQAFESALVSFDMKSKKFAENGKIKRGNVQKEGDEEHNRTLHGTEQNEGVVYRKTR